MTSTATPQTTLERGEFQNEAFIDFNKPENRKSMEDALRQVKGMFGREYPLVIDGKKITTTDKIKSINPSHPEEIIGIFQKASVDLAKQAVEAANRAFEKWRKAAVAERVAVCFARGASLGSAGFERV